MARVHVESWRETYRGLLPTALLDADNAVDVREKFWHGALTDPRYAGISAAVAEIDGTIVGIAMSGPAQTPGTSRLNVLYVLRTHHGTGLGAVLLDSVLPSGVPAVLWVADPNPRAQAFYRKHWFVPDGTVREVDGMREIQLARDRGIPA